MLEWKPNVYKVGTKIGVFDDCPPGSVEDYRKIIEPWLSAVFQSEHFSLLLGSGFTKAVCNLTGVSAADMRRALIKSKWHKEIDQFAEKSAKAIGRNDFNIEDQIRAVMSLYNGFEVMQHKSLTTLRNAINRVLSDFLKAILLSGEEFIRLLKEEPDKKKMVDTVLSSFLMSFASRTPSRERLHIFTTNYDRFIEYGCDIAGIRIIDRFVGALSPLFRSSRLEIDIHYNPPGMRGEPRYLEGVIRFTKLHGSIDWRFENGELRRCNLSFGANKKHPDIPREPIETVMIYPNPAKDIETSEYPYAELFRDFSAAICRPNSVLVTYGYGFGDDHINRVIRDMLTIPSTHLVIISYNDASGRIPSFCSNVGHNGQISLLLGNYFGDFLKLVGYFLPKPSIDQISWRVTELMKRRGKLPSDEKDGSPGEE